MVAMVEFFELRLVCYSKRKITMNTSISRSGVDCYTSSPSFITAILLLQCFFKRCGSIRIVVKQTLFQYWFIKQQNYCLKTLLNTWWFVDGPVFWRRNALLELFICALPRALSWFNSQKCCGWSKTSTPTRSGSWMTLWAFRTAG